MVNDLVQKLAKKKGKGGCVLLLQNTTDMVIVVTASSLTKGKPEKSAPMPASMAALSATEVGFYAPEGQWSFASQADTSVKTRLTILHGSQHANLEKLPASCPWTADLQQNWKADIPQIIVTFTSREDTAPASASTPPKSASTTSVRSDSGNESSPGSGKTKGRGKASKEHKESKAHADGEEKEKESPAKTKKGKKKARESVAPETVHAEPQFEDHAFTSPSSAAFGIDAEMGDDSSDSDSERGRGPSGWGKKFVINTTTTQEPAGDDSTDLMKRASMIMVKGTSRAAGVNVQASPAPAAGSAGDDDFFKDLDMTRRTSTRHLSIPPAERERRLAQIPPAAQAEFDKAIEKLNQGRIQESSNDIHAALSQLNELAFKNNVAIATEWCRYGQLTGILVEMDRLKEAELFAQRALLARFVGLLALQLENQEHALIGLRMAVNRNLEMENYRTVAQLLQSMVTLPTLTDVDRENIPKKQAICASKSYAEANIPVDAVLDATSGQFLLHGYSYTLCHSTMQLIRDPTHLVCSYCQATFSEKSRTSCSFCDHPLASQN